MMNAKPSRRPFFSDCTNQRGDAGREVGPDLIDASHPATRDARLCYRTLSQLPAGHSVVHRAVVRIGRRGAKVLVLRTLHHAVQASHAALQLHATIGNDTSRRNATRHRSLHPLHLLQSGTDVGGVKMQVVTDGFKRIEIVLLFRPEPFGDFPKKSFVSRGGSVFIPQESDPSVFEDR